MKVAYRVHALQRMAQRGILSTDVEEVIANGTTIENYPIARPLPARLILGWTRATPLHVVAAFDAASQTTEVVTVYRPDPSL